MKKLGIAFLLMLLVTAVMALPAAAKPKEPVGTQLNILSTATTTFPANTPFHIRHGWAKNPTTEAVGHFSFALDLDGTRLSEDFVLRTSGRRPSGRSFISRGSSTFPLA